MPNQLPSSYPTLPFHLFSSSSFSPRPNPSTWPTPDDQISLVDTQIPTPRSRRTMGLFRNPFGFTIATKHISRKERRSSNLSISPTTPTFASPWHPTPSHPSPPGISKPGETLHVSDCVAAKHPINGKTAKGSFEMHPGTLVDFGAGQEHDCDPSDLEPDFDFDECVFSLDSSSEEEDYTQTPRPSPSAPSCANPPPSASASAQTLSRDDTVPCIQHSSCVHMPASTSTNTRHRSSCRHLDDDDEMCERYENTSYQTAKINQRTRSRELRDRLARGWLATSQAPSSTSPRTASPASSSASAAAAVVGRVEGGSEIAKTK